MRKLIVIQGIPGSGKSTLARKLLKQDKENKTIIVNRDSIRSMCGEYWVPTREPLITDLEFHAIGAALGSDYSVIVDAINLNAKTLKLLHDMAYKYKVRFETVPIKMKPWRAYLQILKRTLTGGRYISYKVVKDFYYRYKSIIGV